MPVIGQVWKVRQTGGLFMIANITPNIILGVTFSGERRRLPPSNLDMVATLEHETPSDVIVPCSVPSCQLRGWLNVSHFTFCPIHVPIGAQSGLTSSLRTTTEPFWDPLPCPTCKSPLSTPYWDTGTSQESLQHTSCPICSTQWVVCPSQDAKAAIGILNRTSTARVVLADPEALPRLSLEVPTRSSPLPPEGHVLVCSRDPQPQLNATLTEGSVWVTRTGGLVDVVRLRDDHVHFRPHSRDTVTAGASIMLRDDFLGYHQPLCNTTEQTTFSTIPEVGQEWVSPDGVRATVKEVHPALFTVIVEDVEGQQMSLNLRDFQGTQWTLSVRRTALERLLDVED